MIPLVVDIKRHSLEDGPGIRTTVFFKGCPLRCVFCHNPEAQSPYAEIKRSDNHCIKCRNCVDSCPLNALSFRHNSVFIDNDSCNLCGQCADACPGDGIRLIGRQYSADQLSEILLRDTPYYSRSGGGITFSGGECLLYPEYLNEISGILKGSNIHIAVQTSGHFDFARCIPVLKNVDTIYYDLKIMNSDEHLRYTGVSNQLILRNFSLIMEIIPAGVIPGFTLIPGITDTRRNITEIISFFRNSHVAQFYIHPFNPSGIDKQKIGNLPGLEKLFHFMNSKDEYSAIARVLEEGVEKDNRN